MQSSLPPPAPPKKSNTLVIVLAVVGGLLFVVIAVVGILAALGIHGVRRYVAESKSVEGRMTTARLAQSVASCQAADPLGGETGLPTSTQWVPADLEQVSGRKYMSAPSDWSEPGFSCGGFSLSMPQYFRYRWEQVSPTSGFAHAEADLNGDGIAELTYRAEVTCTAGSCSAGSVQETRK